MIRLTCTLLVIAAGALAYTLLLSAHLHVTMDEFLAYHPIACALQECNAEWNRMTDRCGGYDLAPLPWLFREPAYLPLRAYWYVGSVQSLLYFPLYLAWPSPHSARFFGMLMLGLQSILLGALFSLRPLVIGAFLFAFFPYAFQHLVDTGQLSVTLTVLLLQLYLARGWTRALATGSSRAWWYAGLSGFLYFVIVWIRPNNVLYLAPFGVLHLYSLWSDMRSPAWIAGGRKLAGQCALMAFVFVTGVGILATAIDRSGRPYYELFLRMNGEPTAIDLSPFSVFPEFEERFSRYLLNPLSAAHVIARVSGQATPQGVALIALTLVFLGTAWSKGWRREYRSFSILCFALFLGTLPLVSLLKNAWAMHHLIPAFPFLILAILSQIPRHGTPWALRGAAALFLLVNASLYREVARAGMPGPNHARALIAFNDELNRRFAETHIFMPLDWGIYFLKLVYGPRNQCMAWPDNLDDPRVRAIYRSVGRPVVFLTLSSKSTPERRRAMEGLAHNLAKADFGSDTGSWEAWYQSRFEPSN